MYEWNDDKLYPRFNALKKKNAGLRTLLAVGGWNHENHNSPFSKMVKTAASRKVILKATFIADLSEQSVSFEGKNFTAIFTFQP